MTITMPVTPEVTMPVTPEVGEESTAAMHVEGTAQPQVLREADDPSDIPRLVAATEGGAEFVSGSRCSIPQCGSCASWPAGTAPMGAHETT